MFGLNRIVWISLVAVSLAGCFVKRGAYDVPVIPLPDQFKNSESAVLAPSLKSEDKPAPDSALPPDPDKDATLVEWWRAFGNRELSELIDRGLANNPDVKIAILRVAQAKIRADQAEGAKSPTVTAPLMVGRQAPGGSIGVIPPEGGGGNPPQTSYQASLRGTWRPDLWGEQASLAESAKFQLWQAAFERDNVQRNLVATLAANYVEYVSLNDRLKVARETETVLSSMLTTIEKRVAVGDATLMELEQQRAAIFAVRATTPSLEQQREDASNTIAFLVGAVPSSLSLSDDGLDSLQVPEVLPGLPSSLLLRRPDVRMVEARLLAADADIDVARARVLPPIDLSAQGGYSSLVLSQLFLPKFLFWNTLASLTASIFDGAKRSGDKEQSKLAHEEMVETYVRTIHQAMREAEGALATIRLASRRLDAQEEATISSRRAWDISNEVYAAGGADFLTLLDTERTYHRYLDEYQRIKMDRYRGYISLFQALGGGVRLVAPMPGKGDRPRSARDSSPGIVMKNVSNSSFNADGVDWVVGPSLGDGGSLQIENFWQVELSGLYHRETIGAAWRDLRARFPKQMENRILRPRLNGRIEESVDGQIAWYRLYVAKFSTAAAAHEFCALLQGSQQRCRVLSSRSDEVVLPEPVLAKSDKPTVAVKAGGDEGAPRVSNGVQSGLPGTPEVIAASAELEKAQKTQASARVLSTKAGGLQSSAERGAVEAQKNDKKTSTANPSDSVRDRVAYTVQLGAFSNLENAEISQAFWQFKDYEVYVSEISDTDGRMWYAVRTGVFSQRRDAASLAQTLKQKEDASAVIVPTLVNRLGQPAVVELGDGLQPSRNRAAAVPEPPEALKPVESLSVVTSGAGEPTGKTKPAYAVQFGAFSGPENASVSLAFWRGKGYEAYATEIRDASGRVWYAVRVGAFTQRKDALAMALSLGRKEEAPAVVVPTQVDAAGQPKSVALDALVSNKDQSAKAVAVAGSSATEPMAKAKPLAKKVKPAFSVQLGAFSSLENAAKSLDLWQGKGYSAYVCEIRDANGRVWYAVRSGGFAQRREAMLLLRTLERKEDAQAVLVPALLDKSGELATIDVAHLAGAPQ